MRPLITHNINFEYIVEYLCEQKDEEVNKCMGSCHLSDDIIDELTQENKENDKATITNIKPITPHQLSKNNSKLIIIESDKYYRIFNSPLQSGLSEPLLPPPKFYS
jgi:hypothetical protein